MRRTSRTPALDSVERDVRRRARDASAQELKQEEQAGYEAGKKGRPTESNPNIGLPDHSQAWLKGWRRAQSEK